jgi:hypothetical protein
MQGNTHLGRNDARHCCLAKPWRTREQNMVCCLPALLCRTKDNVEMFF